MAEYFSPGVYIEEYDNSPRSIEGVGTSTAGFVGLAEKGPTVGAPSLVTNFKSFIKQFGGFLSEFTHGEYRYLANSVEQFFVNGGTRCYVARVVPEDALVASNKKGILTVEAANAGKWGNRIQISMTTVAKRKLQLIAESGEGYVAKSVEGFREGDIVECNGEYNRIASIYDKTISFDNKFEGNVVDDTIIPKTVLYLVNFDLSVRYNDEVENYTELSLNTASSNYIGSRLALSELISASVEPMTEIGNPVEAILGEGVQNGFFTLEQCSQHDGSSRNYHA